RMTTYTKPIKDAAGNTYIARRGFTGGDLVEPLPPTTDIKGTTSDTLYRPELIRWKNWSHPLPNGTYTITLHTREAFWNKPGQRIFDIKAEGTTKLTNIDIYKAAGKNTAHDLRLTTTVTDGRLDITPINKTNLALLSAITITRTDKKPAPPSNPKPPTTTQRPSGMPFDSGLFPMHRADIATQFIQHRGRAADVITVFPSRENWAEMSNDWFMDNQRIPTRYTGTLDVGVPLWPDDGNLTTASTGGYNTQWENFGRMIAAKYPTAYIRLGWEMNLPGWKHAAYAHSATQWKQAYRHAVTALRKSGPRLRIAWVVNEGPGQTDTTDARTFYPGDDYVDYIGMDAYDWDPGYTNDTNIAHHRDAPYGWNFWLNFAKTHNKKFVLPEWGIAPANPNSGGDNPRYIAFVYDWLTRNAHWIGYESYFHENAPYIRSNLFTDNPHATAEYLHRMKRP
ncbi:malectin domain-containing carbohydrate-binding protein, partial [Dermatophilus congolensis]